MMFGGDPTGVKDSTQALQLAISVCLNQSKLSPNGNFPGGTRARCLVPVRAWN